MASKLIRPEQDFPYVDTYNRTLGIYRNGMDNQYPIHIEQAIGTSPTATQCAWLYESFLGGGGFIQDMSKIDLSENDFYLYSPDDLLIDIAESISKHQGVFIHINYNALFQKEDFDVIPYDQCRLGKKDDKDYYGKIVISKNGWGRELEKDELILIDTYNPREDVIQAQVDAAGGWDEYKGQVLFFTFQPKRIYPQSLLDTAFYFADTEFRMGLYFNSTTKRGFNDAKLVRHKKFENKQDEQQFEKNLKGLMGAENSSSIMTVEDDWDSDNQDGNIKIETLSGDIKAEKYQHFEDASANYIRKAFKNIPPQLVDYVQGKLGNTSGEDLIKAQAVYNALIARDRMRLERLFSILFDNYKETINPANNWEIKQYSLMQDGTVNQ